MSDLLTLLGSKPVLDSRGESILLRRALLGLVNDLFVKDLHGLHDEADVSLLVLSFW